MLRWTAAAERVRADGMGTEGSFKEKQIESQALGCCHNYRIENNVSSHFARVLASHPRVISGAAKSAGRLHVTRRRFGKLLLRESVADLLAAAQTRVSHRGELKGRGGFCAESQCPQGRTCFSRRIAYVALTCGGKT